MDFISNLIDQLFGPAAAAVSALMWKGLEGPTKFIRTPMESIGMLDAVFGQAWGSGGKIAVYAFLAILGIVVMGRMRLVENLPYALLGVAMTSTAGGLLIWNLHHELLQVAPLTVSSIMPPETLTADNISKPFFPPTDDGINAVGLYTVYWAIAAVLMVMKAIAWVGRDLGPGLLIVGFSLWAFSGIGRSFLRWTLMFYACCILLLDMAVALVATGSYNIMQNAKREETKAAAVIALFVVIGVVTWALIAGYKKITSTTAGGWIRSKVKGRTKSDVDNEPRVQVRDQEIVAVPPSAPVESPPMHSPNPDNTSPQEMDVRVTDNKLVSGDITLSTRPLDSASPGNETPQQSIDRLKREAGWN